MNGGLFFPKSCSCISCTRNLFTYSAFYSRRVKLVFDHDPTDRGFPFKSIGFVRVQVVLLREQVECRALGRC